MSTRRTSTIIGACVALSLLVATAAFAHTYQDNNAGNFIWGHSGHYDALYGEGGGDHIDGLAVGDYLSGGAGGDTLRGSPGNDVIESDLDACSAANKDSTHGGGDYDTCIRNTWDDVVGCENVIANNPSC